MFICPILSAYVQDEEEEEEEKKKEEEEEEECCIGVRMYSQVTLQGLSKQESLVGKRAQNILDNVVRREGRV